MILVIIVISIENGEDCAKRKTISIFFSLSLSSLLDVSNNYFILFSSLLSLEIK
jgi:hypothetical protein